ncbi:MAG: caspase family protein [Candidatus Latescibacterota bacterium]
MRIPVTAGAFLAALLLAGLAAPAGAAEKWALLIGIGDYAEGDRLDLQGPPNDVRLVEELLLSRLAFRPHHIRKLVDGEATRAAITAAVEGWLAASARPEDTVLLYYSGHGSQVPDLDGDEEDGRDEVLCPADIRLGVPGGEITDDELGRLFGKLRATDITVVLDACHAGTGARDIDLGIRPLQLRYVDLQYPEPPGGARGGATRQAAPDGMDLPALARSGTRGTEGGSGGFTTVASCAPHETSASTVFYEGLNRVWSGVLTYNLVAALRRAGSGTTYDEVMSEVVRDVKRVNRRQTPQLEGNGARPLFANAAGDIPSRAGIRITEVTPAGAVEMSTSAPGYETVGSIYRVLSADNGQTVGRVKVTRAFGLMVDGVVVEGQGKVQAPAMALEEYHAASDEKLHVRVGSFGGSDARAGIEAALDRLDFVFTANTDTAYADLRVEGTAESSLFSRTRITAWTEEAGVRGPQATGTSAEEVVGALRPQLDNAYAIKRLSRLDNPSPPFRVAVWATRTPKPGERRDRFQELPVGDPIYFHCRVDRDAYLTLLNVGAEGTITILYPNAFYPNSRVVAGKTYTIPSPEMGFELQLAGPPGQELVKALATQFPVDLASLGSQQVGQFRSLDPAGGGAGGSVVDGLTRALQGHFDANLASATRAIVLSAAPAQAAPPPGTSTDVWSTDYLIIDAR